MNEGLERHNAAIPEVVLTPRGVAWELLLNKRITDFIAKSDVNPNMLNLDFKKKEEERDVLTHRKRQFHLGIKVKTSSKKAGLLFP